MIIRTETSIAAKPNMAGLVRAAREAREAGLTVSAWLVHPATPPALFHEVYQPPTYDPDDRAMLYPSGDWRAYVQTDPSTGVVIICGAPLVVDSRAAEDEAWGVVEELRSEVRP